METCRCEKEAVSRREALVAAGLTLGSALLVAAIMLIERGPLGETIGLVMFPGVLAVGPQWLRLRRRSLAIKLALIGAPFAVLFAIGLAAGLAVAT